MSEERGRKSLIIGISAYPDKILPNAVRDATCVHEIMVQRGFDSTLVLDPDFDRFNRELEQFKFSAAGADFGCLYFAGHGMEVNGEGFVQPIDFPNPFSARLLRHRGISIADLLNALDTITGPKVLILDACRIPFDNFDYDEWQAVYEGIRDSRRPGIPRENTLVAYSTGPNQVALDGAGKNSVYCEEFCSEFLGHGSTVEECFKRIGAAVKLKTGQRQQPWYSCSLAQNVTFSDLPRYVLQSSIKIPTTQLGAILNLYGDESSDNAYLSDGDRSVWRVSPASLKVAASLRRGRLVASAILPSSGIALISTDSVVSLSSKSIKGSFDARISNTHGFVWSKTGAILVVYGAEGFSIFRIEDGKLSAIFVKRKVGPFYCCCFIGEDVVLLGGSGAVVRVSNLNLKPKFRTIISDRFEHFYSISLSSPFDLFAVTTNSGSVLWYNASTFKWVSNTLFPKVVQTTTARRQSLLDWATEEVLNIFENKPESLDPEDRGFLEKKLTPNRFLFSAVATNPHIMAVISVEGSIYIIDIRTRKLAQLIYEPSGGSAGGEGVCFLNSRLLCVATTNGMVSFFRPVDPLC